MVSAINSLGYQVVPRAENYQFVKPGPGGADQLLNHVDEHVNEFQGVGVEKEMKGFQGAGFAGLYFNRYDAVLITAP